MAFLIQLLLPLRDNQGRPFPRSLHDGVREALTESFGGVTAYRRAPAEGAWVEDGGEVEHDQIVIYEVMADRLDRDWWTRYRAELEAAFRQEELVVRVLEIERI